MLLFYIKGPTCFADLKIIDKEVCETYQLACKKLNLLDDDDHLYYAL